MHNRELVLEILEQIYASIHKVCTDHIKQLAKVIKKIMHEV